MARRGRPPRDFDAEIAANVLARLDAARETLKAIEADRQRTGQMAEAISGYDRQVAAVAAASELDRAAGDDVGTVVELLALASRAHEGALRETEEAARRLNEATEQTARADKRKLTAVEEHRNSLDVQRQLVQEWTVLLDRLGWQFVGG